MKLINAVKINIEDEKKARKYLEQELPGEDVNREINEIYSDESCTVYEDEGCAGVYFINHAGGWSSTDNIEEDYPEIYEVIKED